MSVDAMLSVLAAAAFGTVRWPQALRAAGSFTALATASRADCTAFGLDAPAYGALQRPDPARILAWRRWLDAPARRLIPLGARGYPARLAETADAPLALWAEGARPDLLDMPQIAIVGSRNASAGGRAIAAEFAHALGRCGITITSGLAVGIDAAAHTGALESTAGTVAVLGTGIDRIYPRRNTALAARVRADGVVISEYPPGVSPRAYRFPERNRIIAGLALGTLVVEAAARSGSLITARLACDYGREVFAVPGSIRSTLSRGCHRLLKSGACLVEKPDDILAEIGCQLIAAIDDQARQASTTAPAEPDSNVRKILNRLDFSPITLKDLATDTGLTTKELSSMLLHLEMEGTVEALPGGRYCRLS